MKELIKEAKSLYKNIDETQSHLIKARLDKDRIREHLELIGLETIVFDAKQLLKCIIDRKDNIVDLGEIWHNNKDIPHKDRKIIAVACNEILCGTFMVEAGWYRANINSVKVLASWESIKKWAYVEDLLPKGGEEWNTTK